MKCPYCGIEITEAIKFCPSCGGDLEAVPGETRVMQDGIDALDATYYAPAVEVDETRVAPVAHAQAVTSASHTQAAVPVRPQNVASPSTSFETLPPQAAVPVVTGGTPDDHGPTRRDRALKRFLVFLGAVAVLAGAAFGAYWAWTKELWGGVYVPDVVGMSPEAASTAMEASGLVPVLVELPSDNSVGEVVSTNPEAGRRVSDGSSVTITHAISRVVPNVVGLPIDEARSLLEEAGARDISIGYTTSSQEEGTVVSVEPAPGESFSSSQSFVVTIAQSYVVPNVVGATLEDAQAAIESAGLNATISYVNSEKTKNTVVSMVPTAGTKVEQGSSVILEIASPYPHSISMLAEYFDMTPQETANYLADQGSVLLMAGGFETGNAYALYNLPGNDRLIFTDQPETSDGPSRGGADPLREGTPFYAIRYETWSGTFTAQQQAIDAMIERCGFSEPAIDTVTQETIKAPEGVTELPSDGGPFICSYGEQGSYIWIVLVKEDGNAAAVLVPRNYFDGIDLGKYGGSICNLFALLSLYSW